uniref:PKS/mFAS DH domain-containing protein n=2 Tax=Emiliania huxleyi TaxID=2903 RepID=A0A0D3JYV3_EMIH1
MARAACVSLSGGGGGASLRRVFFLQPLVLDGGLSEVRVGVIEDRFEVTYEGGGDTSTAHCAGDASAASGPLLGLSLAAARASCGEAVDAASLYSLLRSVGLEYGPRYRTPELAAVSRAAGAAVGRLCRRSRKEGTRVHPADLDGSLHLSSLLAEAGAGETRLPFSASLDASAQRVRHLYVTSWERSATPVTATASLLVLGSRRGERGFDEASPSPAGSTDRFGGLSFAASAAVGRAASLPLTTLEAALSLLRVRPASTAPPRLVLLTAGAHAHGASAAPGSHHAGSLGLARTARAEGAADLHQLDLSTASAAHAVAVASALPLDEPDLLLRKGLLLAPRLQPCTQPPSAETDAPTLGSHLLTGGLGGLGLVTARWLAESGARRLILASRNGAVAPGGVADRLPPRCTVLAAACDAAQPSSVARL